MKLEDLELGIIYNDQGKIINHRSLIKVVLNPFLRMIGYNIATLYDSNKNELYNLVLIKCRKSRTVNFLYKNNGKYKIVKRRMLI